MSLQKFKFIPSQMKRLYYLFFTQVPNLHSLRCLRITPHRFTAASVTLLYVLINIKARVKFVVILRLNDLIALKQLVVHHLHKVAKDNLEQELECKILHTIVGVSSQSLS